MCSFPSQHFHRTAFFCEGLVVIVVITALVGVLVSLLVWCWFTKDEEDEW